MWDAKEWTELTTVVQEGDITSVAINAEGTQLATGGTDGTAVFWSLPAGSRVASMDHAGPVKSVAFTAGEAQLLTGSDDGTVRIWATSSVDDALARLPGDGDGLASGFSRSAQYLTIHGDAVSIWTGPDEPIEHISVPEARRSALLSPDGTRAAIAGVGDVVRVWDLTARREFAALSHPGEVDWEAYQKRVGFRHDEQNASIQRPRSERVGTVDVQAFSRDGRYLLTNRLDFIARIWDVTSQRLLASQPYDQSVTAAAFADDGTFVAFVVDGAELLTVGLPDGAQRVLAESHGDRFDSLGISTTGGIVTVVDEGDNNARVRLWRSSDWGELPSIPLAKNFRDIRLSADGAHIGVAGGEAKVSVIATASGREVSTFEVKEPLLPVFSPDGALVAVGGQGQTVQLFNLRRHRAGPAIPTNDGIREIAFSPDSRYLALVERASTRIVATANGVDLARLDSGPDVMRVQFSPDGRYVATIDEAGARLWSWRSEDLVAGACPRLRRAITPRQWPLVSGESFDRRLAAACRPGRP